MTKQEIAQEIRKLEAVATPGEWEGEKDLGIKNVFETGCGCCTGSRFSQEDADLITFMRNNAVKIADLLVSAP